MKEDNFNPASPGSPEVYSANDLIAQADALMASLDDGTQDFSLPLDNQPEPPQSAYAAPPEGYQMAYVQTAEGYQAVYVPAQQNAGYMPGYAQPTQAIPPMYTEPPRQNKSARQSNPPRRSQPSRPAGALRERPRKKPWGKILGACLLSVAIVAVVVWGVVAGATALIRRMGESRNGGYYDDGGYYDGGGNWNGMGGYNDGSYYIDEDGNIINEHGWIIGNIHDGGSYWDEDGNMVIISPIDPNGSSDDSSVYIEGDGSYCFVCADGGLNLRESPDGNRISTIPNGYPVRLLGWQGEWFMVAYESYNDTAIGWVDGNYISPQPLGDTTRYYVHAGGGLNMRNRPSTTGDRLLTIPEGEVVYGAAYYDDWVFVSYNGWYGWVSGDYISTSASKPTQPQQGNQGNTGSTGSYTMADIEAAMAEAKNYYRSRKGKTPSGGLRSDSLTDAQVEELYWEAVSLVVGMQYFPAGQFQNIDGMLELSDGYGFFYQVSDPKIKSMEDWADMYYSVLTDDLACDILCGTPMFMLDGKMYISGGAMGDEGLITQYTTRVEDEPGGYKLIMDVVNIREDYYTGTSERMEWSFTAHCFQEDGVWVFDDAETPYR